MISLLCDCLQLSERKRKNKEDHDDDIKVVNNLAVDPKQFIISKSENEIHLRSAPSIGGKDFVIEDCLNCDIFLLDKLAQVTVDCCSNCLLVLGPCAGSVFLRNCENCIVVSLAKQFRMRDCKYLEVWLVSENEIALEDCVNIECSRRFPLSYTGLEAQALEQGFSDSAFSSKYQESFNSKAYDFNRQCQVEIGQSKINNISTRMHSLEQKIHLEGKAILENLNFKVVYLGAWLL